MTDNLKNLIDMVETQIELRTVAINELEEGIENENKKGFDKSFNAINLANHKQAVYVQERSAYRTFLTHLETLEDVVTAPTVDDVSKVRNFIGRVENVAENDAALKGVITTVTGLVAEATGVQPPFQEDANT
jgi:hypothetical protein